MSDERDDDPDREAILARRRKLIAVALAGLTSAAGCGDDAGLGPQPCLEMAPVPEQTTLTPIDPPDEETDPVAGEPQGGDPNDEGDPADEGGENEPEPRPQVCLRMARPRNPPPQPCLDVPAQLEPVEEPDPAETRPHACLTPRRPMDDTTLKPGGDGEDDLG